MRDTFAPYKFDTGAAVVSTAVLRGAKVNRDARHFRNLHGRHGSGGRVDRRVVRGKPVVRCATFSRPHRSPYATSAAFG